MITLDRRRFILATGSAAALAALPRFAFPASSGGPMLARIEPVTETLFGTSVTDPYRWMENPSDKDWEPFMRSQAAYTRRTLDAIPGREALAERVGELAGALDVVNAIQVAGPWVFLEKRPAGANNFRLYVRKGVDGAERLLIDPESRTQGEVHYAMDHWRASPDGRLVVYGMSPSGSEISVLEILETSTGAVLPDRIDRAPFATAGWLPDGSGFFFNRLAQGAKQGTADFFKDSVCWMHRVGTHPKDDVKVLSRGQFPDVALQDIDLPVVVTQAGSEHVIAMIYSGVQNEMAMYVNSLEAANAGRGGWKKICEPADKVTSVTIRGNDIYLLTFRDAPRYRVLHVTAAAPAVAGAHEVVPQGTAVIQGLAAAKDGIYLHDVDGGIGRIRRLGEDGKVSGVPLPFDGAIDAIHVDAGQDGVWLQLQNWVRPATLFRIAASGEVTDSGLATAPGIDVSPYESIRVFATAKDGTQVPVSVMYRKGISRDGTAPMLIDAYGSYGYAYEPRFDERLLVLLDHGGVWAVAHVRGGGEFGREWHEGGRLLTKPNTWGDLIASAERLIADRWTSASKLAIRGVSAGGITVGRALTDRPDLFAVVIGQVGAFNSLREEFSQAGPPNVPEFGSVATADGFKGLLAMDSYQHVRDGAEYPAVLLTTGMTDPRVDPWEPAKMAARLQQATASGKPVLLRVDFQAGHGFGSTRAQIDEEVADILAFMLWQVGAKGFQPAP